MPAENHAPLILVLCLFEFAVLYDAKVEKGAKTVTERRNAVAQPKSLLRVFFY